MNPTFLLLPPLLGAVGGAQEYQGRVGPGALGGSIGGAVGAPVGLVGGSLMALLLGTIMRRISHDPRTTQVFTRALMREAPYVGALAGGYLGGKYTGYGMNKARDLMPNTQRFRDSYDVLRGRSTAAPR